MKRERAQYHNAYYAKNRTAILARRKPTTYAARAEYFRTYAQNRYVGGGVTPDLLVTMFAAQGGRCAICGTDEFNGRGNRPHLDHDHTTGKIRGLLCHSCNTGMGALGDSPEILREAAAYLESYR